MSSSRQRTERKARASRRNAKRSSENATATAVLLSPEEATRSRIRNQSAAKAGDERRRATRLLAPLRDPPPDETVTSLQSRAEAQRRLAAALDGKATLAGAIGRTARRERKVCIVEAKRLEIDAGAARDRQLLAHRQATALREISSQAKARGDDLEEIATEVPEWVRDEHGALARDDRGLPVLNVERATTRRQKHGLDWLLTKGRITHDQYRTGKSAEAIWASAAQAAEPGRAESGTGGHACKPSAGPADWRMEAMLRVKQMEIAITSLVEGDDGVQIVRTCKAVCHEGQTTQRLSDDRYEQVRAEERLKLGLALIRYWLSAGGVRLAA